MSLGLESMAFGLTTLTISTNNNHNKFLGALQRGQLPHNANLILIIKPTISAISITLAAIAEESGYAGSLRGYRQVNAPQDQLRLRKL
jgi:hypothetical protein